MRFLILDTETTGFVPKVHRVMEVACMVMEDRDMMTEVEHLLSLPENVEIPIAIQRLTHISPDDLKGKPTFQDIQASLESLLTVDTILVGQNIPFDLGMLRGEGWDLTEHPWIDTSMLASIVFPELQSFSLGLMSDVLGLNHTPRHRALGDVRATAELLMRCIDRFQELSSDQVIKLQKIAEKGPKGYQRFFAEISSTSSGKQASWLKKAQPKPRRTLSKIRLPDTTVECVSLIEEPLEPDFLESVAESMNSDTWLAVKNLEAAVERKQLPSDIVIIYPPEFLLSNSNVDTLRNAPNFTADEMTLLMKITLLGPLVRRDIAIHGGEHQVWNAKIGCDAQSPEYRSLLTEAIGHRALISHQHLMTLAIEGGKSIPPNTHVIIDDASMLEDTATNALAWTCHIPTLRAASAGHALLTQCTDIIELWTERTRNELDLRYLAPSDLSTRETHEMSSLLNKILVDERLPASVMSALGDLLRILDASNLPGRITWIESMIDGSKTIKSVPDRVADKLRDLLYKRWRTTLLVPPSSTKKLSPIIPYSMERTLETVTPGTSHTLVTEAGCTVESFLKNPIDGKAVILVSSKRSVEDIYVRYADVFEARGSRIICQGFAGGQGRMQAEFLRAEAGSVLVMTPWMYEGIHLPSRTVSTLVLQALPFDHPHHAIVSQRALRYSDPFNEYSLPRLTMRLFRILRTFADHAIEKGTVMILDDRLRSKTYGKNVLEELQILMLNKTSKVNQKGGTPVITTNQNKRRVKKKKIGNEQMSLL